MISDILKEIVERNTWKKFYIKFDAWSARIDVKKKDIVSITSDGIIILRDNKTYIVPYGGFYYIEIEEPKLKKK